MENYTSPNGRGTFVAFVDISGFKKFMKMGKGPWALSNYFNAGYNRLINPENKDISGIFVSDSGILFARADRNSDNLDLLKKLLYVVRNLNQDMLRKKIMLTTSIAYGSFDYNNRIVLRNMDKEYFHGDAYIDAYLDGGRKPKLTAGQCRIVKEGLPIEIKDGLDSNSSDNVLKMIRTPSSDKKRYYYYWMRDEPSEIETFEEDYSNSIFNGMYNALKGNRIF